MSGPATALIGLAAAGSLIALRYLTIRAALNPGEKRRFRRLAVVFLTLGGLAAVALSAVSGSLALPAAPALILGIVAFWVFIRVAGKGEH